MIVLVEKYNVSTPLHLLLDEAGLSSYLAVLNASRIGPSGDGDGDIIGWWFYLVRLGICYVITIAPGDPIVDSQIPTNQQIPKSENIDLVEVLEDLSHKVFDLQFPAPSEDQKSAWGAVFTAMVSELRHQWGGRTIRVPKRPKSLLSPEYLVKIELLNGTPIKDIPAKTGLSRASVYRHLKKR